MEGLSTGVSEHFILSQYAKAKVGGTHKFSTFHSTFIIRRNHE